MSNTVIKIENLSKKYVLSHNREPYLTLRDTLANGFRSITRKISGKDDDFQKNEEFWALKDINLEIKQGEKIGIIGRNGAGKSTLLKILSRITEPTTGTVKIKGRVASLLEVGTGFHPELTGRENIFLNGAILGMKKQEIKSKFDEIVDFSGVEKFLDTPVKRYSSGMYVRLAFAVAAHLEPEILLIDEVLAVGDAEFQKKCLGKMDDVAKQGRTVIFVSHNMAAVRQLCERGMLIENGKAKKIDSVDKVFDLYNFAASITVSNVDLSKIHRRSNIAKFKNFIVDDIVLKTFKSAKFKFVIFSSGDINNVSLSISFKDSMGNNLFQLFSEHMGIAFKLKKGDNTITLDIDSLPLMEGVYKVNFWLGNNSKNVLDFIADGVSLKINKTFIENSDSDIIENRGYPLISKCNWRLND